MSVIAKLKGISRNIQVRRTIGKRFDNNDKYLDSLLLALRIGDISVEDFVYRYQKRDTLALKVCESFNNIDKFRNYLEKTKISTQKYDYDLPEVINLDELVLHEKAHLDAAAKFGVKTRYTFYSKGTNWGGQILTTNLNQVGKDWSLEEFEVFWKHFIEDVHKNFPVTYSKSLILNSYHSPGSEYHPIKQ